MEPTFDVSVHHVDTDGPVLASASEVIDIGDVMAEAMAVAAAHKYSMFDLIMVVKFHKDGDEDGRGRRN